MSDRELGSLRDAWASRAPRPPGPDCPPAEAIWEAVVGKRLTREEECLPKGPKLFPL